MAKGKRAGGKRPRDGPAEITFNPRVKAIQQWGDEEAMEAGGEDAFHAGRDKIDIDGSGPTFDNEGFEMDDEVLALRNFSESEEDEEAYNVDTRNTKKSKFSSKNSDAYEPVSSTSKLSRFSKKANNNGSEEDDSEEEDEEEETWHPSSYHVRRDAGDAEVDSEDEDAVALDLAETRRIQKMFRSRLDEADFGLAQEEWDINLGNTENDGTGARTKTTDQASSRFQTRDEEIQHLVQTSPQLLKYANHYVKICEILPRLESVLGSLRNQEKQSDEFVVGALVVYQESLSKYLSSLSRYFELQFKVNVFIREKEEGEKKDAGAEDYPSSNNNTTNKEILLEALERVGNHVVEMTNFVQSLEREHVASIGRDLRLFAVEEKEKLAISTAAPSSSTSDDDDDENMQTATTTIESPTKASEDEDVGKMLTEGEEEGAKTEKEPVKTKKTRKRSRRKTEKGNGHKLKEGELERIKFTEGDQENKQDGGEDDDDFIESIRLSTSDKTDKTNKRKSLQFYTSKIDTKEAKRIGGSKDKRGRVGGDEDIPYRNKEQIRRQILQRQNHATTGEQGGAGRNDDYDDDVMEYDERNGLQRADDVEMDDEQDYYDLVKSAKKARVAEKKQEYDQAVLDERMLLASGHDDHGSGNPRGISRTILKNRGITPKRSKENRNPRVKKRKRFETAKRKVASMHAVYSAERASAAAGGAYAGEKSGIGRNTVKSRKF